MTTTTEHRYYRTYEVSIHVVWQPFNAIFYARNGHHPYACENLRFTVVAFSDEDARRQGVAEAKRHYAWSNIERDFQADAILKNSKVLRVESIQVPVPITVEWDEKRLIDEWMSTEDMRRLKELGAFMAKRNPDMKYWDSLIDEREAVA